jgi:metacaspase-1
MDIFIQNTTNTSTTKSEAPAIITSNKKVSFSYGINMYPDPRNNLQGCVNDAKDWADLLTNIYGFKNTLKFDKEVTYSAVYEILGNMIADAKSGDKLVLTGSSHGTSVTDKDGDDIDGKDEAVCLYDNIMLDDTFRNLIAKMVDGVSLTIISDSCFSGSVTREFLSSMSEPKYMKPRYMPPEDCVEANLVISLPKKMTREIFPEENMREVLISGCSDNQYSYDAYIGGSYRGAMSYYATKVIRANPTQTYAQFYANLRRNLPSSNYSQTPQLESSAANKNKPLFT